MFKFTKRNNAPDLPQPQDSLSPYAANSSKPATDVQRELVLLAFKDTVRHSGVPPQWLDCEVRVPAAGSPFASLQVIITVQHWSGHLLRYARAFQQQVKDCLDRYEPMIDHAEYEWVWRFSADCDCPFMEMPEPGEWVQKLAAVRTKSLSQA